MVINTLVLCGPSAKTDDTMELGAIDRDILTINLIPLKCHIKKGRRHPRTRQLHGNQWKT